MGNNSSSKTETDVREYDKSKGFSLNLLQIISKKGKNMIISPLSIYFASCLLANAVEESLQNDVLKCLEKDNEKIEEINTYNEELIKALEKDDILTIANVLFSKKKVIESYKDLVYKYYDCKVCYNINNSNLSDWISQNTNGLIQISHIETFELLLVNAVYSKANWKYEFKAENNYSRKFKGTKKTNKVEFMQETFKHYDVSYFEDEEVQIIQLPYVNTDYCSIIILPKINLSNFISKITKQQMNEYLNSLRPKEVEFHLPKAKISYSCDIKTLLRNMGLKELFTPSKKFNIIEDNRDLYVESIIHNARIDINEQGTEAAAFTMVDIRGKISGPNGAPEPEKKKIMIVDKPFVMFIKKNKIQEHMFTLKIENL